MYTEHHCLHIACLTFTTAFIITIIVVYDFHHKDIITHTHTHTHSHTQSWFFTTSCTTTPLNVTLVECLLCIWISCSWKECLKTIFLKYVWKYIFFIAIFFYIIHRKEPPVACFCESSVRVHLLPIFFIFCKSIFRLVERSLRSCNSFRYTMKRGNEKCLLLSAFMALCWM